MGKKKDKKTVRDSDFYTPDKQMRKTLDYFGVKAAGGGGRPGNMGTGSDNRRTADDVKADLKAAKASHYAFNRGLEAAAMSGDKKSRSLMKSGMGNIGGIMRGVKHLGKLKKDNFGGGGMNGGENQSVLAYDLVNKDREEQTAGYNEDFALKTDLAALRKEMDKRGDDTSENVTPATLSEASTAAKNAKDEYELNLGASGNNIFGGGSPQEQAQAQEFKDSAVNTVKEGLKMSSVKARGPQSGFIEGEGF